ncbi:hypothetical protein FKW77_000150 [Venturia effusa]|uniref:L-lactate dehydrogenase (cytochrome) n=1 Tax=Venturia effusa TaxID=50376 RepID=A0A517LM06_9PEZI|nr:hypothetical protein FKW77_000150 [Venturia effusa]
MPQQDVLVSQAELIPNLNKILLDLYQHPYPEVPSPPRVPKRASVAVIIRIQPNYTHWPPSRRDEAALHEQSQAISVEDRINAFFKQDWVQHGDPEVLFIKRAARVGDKWTSHVAFPGGRRDPEDADDLAAAVREAWEEVGIDLSEENAIATGNLSQRIVTSAWGKQALMTLCPYIFLVTTHAMPPLRLQPTEVASTHWVPLRALLSPAQRTYWYQDVSTRTARTEFDLEKWFHRLALGKMMFAAVRLIPSESKYCSSIAEFMPEEPMRNEPRRSNITIPLYGASWHKPRSPVDLPLLLWGLTLGVMGDFLDMLPPHNALQIWTYPTFSQLDVRFILWVMSYRFRRRKQKELEEGMTAMPAVELGSDSVALRDDLNARPGEGRMEGMGLGRYYGRLAQDHKGSRSSAVGVLLGGYYEIIHKAVLMLLKSIEKHFPNPAAALLFRSPLSYDEVSTHNSPQSCWVILYNKVYDVTSFLSEHPGGSKIILKLSGTDATDEYDPVHPPGTLEESLPASACLGTVDTATLPRKAEATASTSDEPLIGVQDCLNLDEIEALATKRISKKAWAYYYSAGDDLLSKQLNNSVYKSILLRPRVFVDCTRCDPSTTLLKSFKFGIPIFISPAAMARLGHPDGEQGIARACAKFNALQIISNNSSMTPEQVTAGAPSGQYFGWQLYVQEERSKSEKMIERIHKIPNVKFICLTLDAPVPGKREHDEREAQNVGAKLPNPSSLKKTEDFSDAEGIGGSGAVGKALFAGTAPDLTWKTTLPWLAKHTNLPIVLKGIQTHEDAYLASLHAPQVQGIILSNHGGRALDTAPPSIHTLLEIRKYVPEVFHRIDVWIDGGIKRGTDVVKALALGAKAVGLGRAALFGLGAGGTEGVERTLNILKAETETCMRLLGVEKVGELGLRHVNARAAERDIFDGEAGVGETLLKSSKAKL